MAILMMLHLTWLLEGGQWRLDQAVTEASLDLSLDIMKENANNARRKGIGKQNVQSQR